MLILAPIAARIEAISRSASWGLCENEPIIGATPLGPTSMSANLSLWNDASTPSQGGVLSLGEL